MRPHAREAREQIFVLRQLDLRLGVGRLRVLGEDVEDKVRAVHHLAAHKFLNITLLRRWQLIINDHHVDIVFMHVVGHLADLAGAEIGACVRMRKILSEHLHALTTGGLHQKGQLVEVLQRLRLRHIGRGNRYQHGRLAVIVRVFFLLLLRHYTLSFQTAKIHFFAFGF